MNTINLLNLPRIGDMIAIPFFLWLMYYFYKKNILTFEERILFLFVIGGFIADIIFVFYI